MSLPTEIEAIKIFYSEHWKQFNDLGALSESADKKLLVDLSNVFASLIEKSNLEKSDKEESKTYIKLLLIENNEDELQRVSQEIELLISPENQEIKNYHHNNRY